MVKKTKRRKKQRLFLNKAKAIEYCKAKWVRFREWDKRASRAIVQYVTKKWETFRHYTREKKVKFNIWLAKRWEGFKVHLEDWFHWYESAFMCGAWVLLLLLFLPFTVYTVFLAIAVYFLSKEYIQDWKEGKKAGASQIITKR